MTVGRGDIAPKTPPIIRSMCSRHLTAGAVLVLAAASTLSGQQTIADRYTRFELIDPPAGVYRVVDDLSAIGGAAFVLSGEAGTSMSEVTVIDRYSGAKVAHQMRDGRIVVPLRSVAAPGENRLRFQYTATNTRALNGSGAEAVFTVTPGAARNAIVLPAGWELLECNVPAQVIEEADGRLNVSSWNTMPVQVPLRVRLRKRAATATASDGVTSPAVMSPGTAASQPANALANLRVTERAIQDREIVYFLQQPDTHRFRLYHDYTESRPGVATYRNVVRGGSTVSEPSAILLDTGAALRVETVTEQDAEVVIIHFPAVEQGKSSRLRITETYTDPGRYGLVNGQLVWNRNFGRPANDVVLPEGWYLTDSTIPATISLEADGRVRLAFLNPRPDSIDVVIKARRR